MNDLIEQLEENAAKLRLLQQDVSRIEMNPIYSLFQNPEIKRREDLLSIQKKQDRALNRRYRLYTALSKEVLSGMENINKQLKQLR